MGNNYSSEDTVAQLGGQEWFHFDDSVVTRVTDVAKIINSDAYMLFYRRRTA
jgi:ubiquitin C-terminal hydrolase